ncbi:PAS domain S-box protein, partial [bacterium]|nr:PAS domain S-box protein [bacterium]
MNFTLKHQLNGAIIVTFLVIAIIFTAIQLPFQKQRRQTSINRIEILLQTLIDRDMKQLANEIFDSRLSALELRLKQMKKVKGILGLEVFDHSGNFIIANGADLMILSLDSKGVEHIRKNPQIQKVQYNGEASLLVSREITFLEEHLGFIKIYFSLQNINQNQQFSFLIFASLLFSILLVMLIVLNLIFSKAILNPIMYLRDATGLIAQGDLDQEINLPREDELGSLAESFMKMQESIKQTILSLEKENAERKKAEGELRESEDKFSKIFYLSPDAISLSSMEEGILIDVNQSYVDLFGHSKNESIGKSSIDLNIWENPIDRKIMVEKIKKKGQIKMFEAKARSKSGNSFYIEVSSDVIEINGKKCLVTMIRDISQRKKTQEIIIQSEKMLSVGGLAAGMAHEINNPLAGMMQSANVMETRLDNKTKLPANEKAAEQAGTTMEAIHNFMEARNILRMLSTIRLSGERVAQIVENMLSFSRDGKTDLSYCDIAQLFDQTIELAGTDYDLKKSYDFKKIRIIKEFQKNLPEVACESSKIQQVLLNILKNGAHAM